MLNAHILELFYNTDTIKN